jgi:hypothetical protein
LGKSKTERRDDSATPWQRKSAFQRNLDAACPDDCCGRQVQWDVYFGSQRLGKSTFEAELAWHDYLRNIGQIIIDPIGVGTTDSFLWKLIRFLQQIPFSAHARYLERIKYVNIAATDYIVPFPLIYKTGAERSLLEVVERYLHTILISSPWLQHAQVQG